MLILTRRVGESLIINDNIEVVITKVKGNQVSVGIDAPKGVGIWRKELYHKGINHEKDKK